MGELLIAERMDPRSPEVIDGRHGLLAFVRRENRRSNPLADSGIRGRCRTREVYIV